MSMVNIGTGELHVLKDTGRVGATAVVGQEAVKAAGAGNLYVPSTVSGAKPDGFALHDAPIGEAFTLVRSGYMVVIAGAATAVDLDLMVNGSARVVEATTGLHVCGKSKTAAAADGDEILIELYHSGYKLP